MKVTLAGHFLAMAEKSKKLLDSEKGINIQIVNEDDFWNALAL